MLTPPITVTVDSVLVTEVFGIGTVEPSTGWMVIHVPVTSLDRPSPPAPGIP